MRNILLIGAGRSSASLINYLLSHASDENWMLTVADFSLEQAKGKINNHPSGKAVQFDIADEEQGKLMIASSDLVISLLPAHLHISVAKECVRQKKNLITASYVSPEISALDTEAKSAGVILMNECGLDPGIDHMSAMEIINGIKEKGGFLQAFRSYTGGLVAPESNDNPWGYKFSWNPRNVILAGQGTAKYIDDGVYRYIPYHRLFAEAKHVHVDGMGDFDGYANRDSLSYRKIYGIDAIPTLIRGTLRQSGYCKAWNVFVQLGITDDSFKFEGSQNISYREFIDAFIPSGVPGKNTEERLAGFTGLSPESETMKMIKWTGLLGDAKIGKGDLSPAGILQNLLEDKWKLKDTDKDMIVMQHQFEYQLSGKKYLLKSSLVVKGENATETAMAKTVGLPVAITAKLILKGSVKLKGVHIPVQRDVYEPVLSELSKFKISFAETQSEIA